MTRICLDAWASLLVGHEVNTVQRAGWSGVGNGRVLALAATQFDVYLTMDGNLEFRQNLATLPVAVLVVEAVSNRMEDLVPLVPGMLREIDHIQPRALRRLAA